MKILAVAVVTNAPLLSLSENLTGTLLPWLKGWLLIGEKNPRKVYLPMKAVCAGVEIRPVQMVGSSGSGSGMCAKFT